MRNFIKIADRIVMSMMLICFLAFSVVFYWLLDREYPAVATRPTISFEDAAGRPIAEARAGEIVYFRREMCVSLDDPRKLDPSTAMTREKSWTGHGQIRGIVHSRFIDGYLILLPDQPFDIDEGCYNMKAQVKIPGSLTPGEYIYKVQVEYFRNPLQRAIGGVTQQVAAVPIMVVK
jgi:hypothetical protein